MAREGTTYVYVYMDQELKDWVIEQAEHVGLSESKFVATLLREHMEKRRILIRKKEDYED